MAWDSSGPQFRSKTNKNYFTTEYEIKCRLCNNIYLVLSAEVTGVLIGQSEVEVGEDVGEDQEHLTFRSVSFSINLNLGSVIFGSLCYHLRRYILLFSITLFLNVTKKLALRAKGMGGGGTVWASFTVNTQRISLILCPINLTEIKHCQKSSLCLKRLYQEVNIF
jgi:hypothetical protein